MAKEEKKTERKRYFEPKCSPLVDVTEWRVDEEGHHYVVNVGEKNFDDEIQLYKDSCDIMILVDRLTKGDAATIKQLATPGLYGDVNDFPQEVHPAAYAQGLAQLYENQPDSVKEKFPTYELFAKYFTNLTNEMVAQMFAPKEEAAAPVEEGGNQ